MKMKFEPRRWEYFGKACGDQSEQEPPQDDIGRYLETFPLRGPAKRMADKMARSSRSKFSVGEMAVMIDSSQRMARRYFLHLVECGLVKKVSGDEYEISDQRLLNHKRTLINTR